MGIRPECQNLKDEALASRIHAPYVRVSLLFRDAVYFDGTARIGRNGLPTYRTRDWVRLTEERADEGSGESEPSLNSPQHDLALHSR